MHLLSRGDGARIVGEAAARRHASTAVSSLVCQTLAFRAPPGARHDHWISPLLSMRRPHYAGKARLMLTTKRSFISSRFPLKILTRLSCTVALNSVVLIKGDIALFPPKWQRLRSPPRATPCSRHSDGTSCGKHL